MTFIQTYDSESCLANCSVVHGISNAEDFVNENVLSINSIDRL